MLLLNICSPSSLYIATDYTLAEQKQLEFVLQAQGRSGDHCFAISIAWQLFTLKYQYLS